MGTTTRSRRNPSAAPPSVAQKAGYHHGSLRSALLDGALELLRTGGIDAVTTRACANLAGVSVGAIRNHFPDKNSLLAGLAASGYELLARRRKPHAFADAGLEKTLEAFIENYVSFAVENSALFRLMFADEGLRRIEYTELYDASRESYGQIRQIFETAFKKDGLDVKDMDSATQLIWSGTHGVAMLVIDRQFSDELLNVIPVKLRCIQLATILTEGLKRTHSSRR